MYTLKKSDGSHEVLGRSNGNRVDQPDNTFWITGWSPQTRGNVSLNGFYTLVFPDGHSNSVEVMELGGEGNGGLRFQFAG